MKKTSVHAPPRRLVMRQAANGSHREITRVEDMWSYKYAEQILGSNPKNWTVGPLGFYYARLPSQQLAASWVAFASRLCTVTDIKRLVADGDDFKGREHVKSGADTPISPPGYH
jgi:hypothetical protein